MTQTHTSSPPWSSELAFDRNMSFDYGVLQTVAPRVRRLVAPNPSRFTYTGTNTYVVGCGDVAVIDPGPDDAEHRDALRAALGRERVTQILATHTHRDHTEGVEALRAATGAQVLGFGPSDAPRGIGHNSPSGKAFVDQTFAPDRTLGDGDTVEGDGWTLEAIFTPGHAPDHLCFALQGARTVFSGDHVMGWNTTVVAPPEGNMGDYIASLQKLLTRNDTVFFPGHGGRIATPQRVVKAYVMHRKMRESAIYQCIESGVAFIPQIVQKLYRNLDADLSGAAALSVLAHVQHLIEKDLVRSEGPPQLLSAYCVR